MQNTRNKPSAQNRTVVKLSIEYAEGNTYYEIIRKVEDLYPGKVNK